MRIFGFQNGQPLLNRSFDGRNCIVQEPLVFRTHGGKLIRTQTFLRTDGGSIPPLSFIGGLVILTAHYLCQWSAWFEALMWLGALAGFAGLYLKSYGRWWWGYVLHDGAYQNLLEISADNGKTWKKYSPSEKESNWLLYQAMESQGAHWWEYTLVWVMLHWFGWRAFDEDRSLRSATAISGK